MLRALQTKALYEKISKMFDTLAAQASPPAQPVLAGVHNAYSDRPQSKGAYYISPRRRRSRRSRLVSASGSFRTSWF